MHIGIPFSKPDRVQVVRDERGQAFVELVLAALLLMVFTFAIVETGFLVRDKVQLQRVVRDAAREVVLSGNLNAGEAAGRDRAIQYFGPHANRVELGVRPRSQYGGSLIIAEGVYRRPMFGRQSGAEVKIRAQAIFGWKDRQE